MSEKITKAAAQFAAFMRGAADIAPHVASAASLTDAIAKGKVSPSEALRAIGESVEVDATITVAGARFRVGFGGPK